MTPVTALWLPILLATVAVFIASSIIHMMSPWHKNDSAKLPSEDAIMAALRPFNLAPDDYLAPKPASMDDMKSPAFIEKRTAGPAFVMTVFPSMASFSMTSNLVNWFIYLLVVSTVAALVAGHVFGSVDNLHSVFHYTALVSFLCYGMALWQQSIWFHKRWSTTLKSNFDALIYAAITGGIFMWLWPHR